MSHRVEQVGGQPDRTVRVYQIVTIRTGRAREFYTLEKAAILRLFNDMPELTCRVGVDTITLQLAQPHLDWVDSELAHQVLSKLQAFARSLS